MESSWESDNTKYPITAIIDVSDTHRHAKSLPRGPATLTYTQCNYSMTKDPTNLSRSTCETTLTVFLPNYTSQIPWDNYLRDEFKITQRERSAWGVNFQLQRIEKVKSDWMLRLTYVTNLLRRRLRCQLKLGHAICLFNQSASRRTFSAELGPITGSWKRGFCFYFRIWMTFVTGPISINWLVLT